jgi:hypothetical protein
MPDLPTIAETGVKGYEAGSWYGLSAPAGTSKEIIARLHAETIKVMALPDVKERLFNAGFEVVTSSPEQFAAFTRSEIQKWGKLVKATGLKADWAHLLVRLGKLTSCAGGEAREAPKPNETETSGRGLQFASGSLEDNPRQLGKGRIRLAGPAPPSSGPQGAGGGGRIHRFLRRRSRAAGIAKKESRGEAR